MISGLTFQPRLIADVKTTDLIKMFASSKPRQVDLLIRAVMKECINPSATAVHLKILRSVSAEAITTPAFQEYHHAIRDIVSDMPPKPQTKLKIAVLRNEALLDFWMSRALREVDENDRLTIEMEMLETAITTGSLKAAHTIISDILTNTLNEKSVKQLFQVISSQNCPGEVVDQVIAGLVKAGDMKSNLAWMLDLAFQKREWAIAKRILDELLRNSKDVKMAPKLLAFTLTMDAPVEILEYLYSRCTRLAVVLRDSLKEVNLDCIHTCIKDPEKWRWFLKVAAENRWDPFEEICDRTKWTALPTFDRAEYFERFLEGLTDGRKLWVLHVWFNGLSQMSFSVSSAEYMKIANFILEKSRQCGLTHGPTQLR